MHAKAEGSMDTDLALQYREARETLIRLNPLDAGAWDAALRESHIRPYGIHHGLMFSGDFLGYVDLLSPNGEAYTEFRSIAVRPARREVYGKTPDGQIQYAGDLLTVAAWKVAKEWDWDAAYHRNRRRRP